MKIVEGIGKEVKLIASEEKCRHDGENWRYMHENNIPDFSFKQTRNEDVKTISREELGRKCMSYEANEMYM